MRARLAMFLRRLAEWLDVQPVTAEILLSVPVDELYARTVALTRVQEQIDGRSGEAKRHQVLAQLRKEFPTTATRSLALAIEAALP